MNCTIIPVDDAAAIEDRINYLGECETFARSVGDEKAADRDREEMDTLYDLLVEEE